MSGNFDKEEGVITIFITQRTNNFHACLGRSEAYAYGETVEEAVGNLVINFQRRFKVRVEPHPRPNEMP